MEYVIIIGHDLDLNKYDYTNKYVIAVDRGALKALQAGIKVDLALGDFDSIKVNQKEELKKHFNLLELPSEKDETDTLAAIKLCKNANKITILGGIQGKRIEHFLANINLLISNPLIEIIDNNSHIYTENSSFSIEKSIYKFYSFMAIEDAIITLNGFKYPLTEYNLVKNDIIGISNELISEKGQVYLKKGLILVIITISDEKYISKDN